MLMESRPFTNEAPCTNLANFSSEKLSGIIECSHLTPVFNVEMRRVVAVEKHSDNEAEIMLRLRASKYATTNAGLSAPSSR